eukprot:c9631_g1_i2.p3 GENE.c9631_g1_i2~~c9631_g1_i2.p3  ORF type:complete len:130 (-),score=33.24 c9631_g1_i2:259-648(-)
MFLDFVEPVNSVLRISCLNVSANDSTKVLGGDGFGLIVRSSGYQHARDLENIAKSRIPLEAGAEIPPEIKAKQEAVDEQFRGVEELREALVNVQHQIAHAKPLATDGRSGCLKFKTNNRNWTKTERHIR